MTNEQLYVLLRNIAERLQDAIDETREMLPDEAPRHVQWDHRLAGWCPGAQLPHRNPEDWQMVDLAEYLRGRERGEYMELAESDFDFLALDPLRELADSLRAQCEALHGEVDA